jgi:tetratricopeptide (TPR) repeat protein
MSRWVVALALAGAVSVSWGAQADGDGLKKDRPAPTVTKEQVPQEEDENLKTEEYAFNPLRAEKELDVGNYYFKKGSYRAAEGRYKEATLWNSGYDEAWLKLGEAEEKLRDKKAAKEAYEKFIEIAGDPKDEKDQKRVADVRKKLDHLK